MAFTGNIKDFPVSDIIQFLYDFRKTGTFRINSVKGECQLVFCEGSIVSANYLNSLVLIGQVLVHSGAITQTELTWALQIQELDPENRQPLVLTLLQNQMVKKNDAEKGLESLILMTIVEVLTLEAGFFMFEECTVDNPSGYHFYLTRRYPDSPSVLPRHYADELLLPKQFVIPPWC